MTMAEMSERANNLRHTIIQQEALLSHLSNQQRAAAANGNPLDPTVAAKIRQSMLDVKGKKDYLQRMMNAMQNNMYVFFPLPSGLVSNGCFFLGV